MVWVLLVGLVVVQYGGSDFADLEKVGTYPTQEQCEATAEKIKKDLGYKRNFEYSCFQSYE